MDLEDEQAAPFRVLTYNMQSGENMDGVYDLEGTAKTILEQKPDIVCLQEVGRKVSFDVTGKAVVEQRSKDDQPGTFRLSFFFSFHLNFKTFKERSCNIFRIIHIFFFFPDSSFFQHFIFPLSNKNFDCFVFFFDFL